MRSGQHRRSHDACVDIAFLDHRPVFRHRRSGRRPVLPLQIPCCQHLPGLSSSLFCHICWTVAESSPPCEIKRITLLLSFLMGKLWARYVPNVSLFGISLNPGPFTVKEHVIITIMAGVGAAPAYAVSIATVSQIISTLSHQFLSDRCYCRPKGSL